MSFSEGETPIRGHFEDQKFWAKGRGSCWPSWHGKSRGLDLVFEGLHFLGHARDAALRSGVYGVEPP